MEKEKADALEVAEKKNEEGKAQKKNEDCIVMFILVFTSYLKTLLYLSYYGFSETD